MKSKISSTRISPVIKSEYEDGADIIMLTSDNNQNSDVADQLRSKGIYYITGEIEPDSLLLVQQDILLKHLNPEWKDDIQIFVNSVGGSCSETWALIDLLDFVKMDVWTTVVGEALSAGAAILAAGTKGKRRATPNASIMIHTVAGGIYGNIAQIAAQTKAFDQEQRKDIRFWTSHSNLTTEEDLCKKLLLDVDNYLTPEQALSFNIIDEIIGLNKQVEKDSIPVVKDKTKILTKTQQDKQIRKSSSCKKRKS